MAAARVYGVIVAGMIALGTAFYFLGIAPLASHHRAVHLDGINGVFNAALDQINTQVAAYANTARQVGSRSAMRERQIAYVRGETTREDLVRFAQPKLADAVNASAALVGATRYAPDGTPLMTVGYGVDPAAHDACPPMNEPRGLDITMRVLAGQAYLRYCAALDDRQGSVIGHDELLFGLSKVASHTIQKSNLTVRYRLALAELGGLSGIDGITPLSMTADALGTGRIRQMNDTTDTLVIAARTAVPRLWLRASVDLAAFQTHLAALHMRLYLAVGLALAITIGLTVLVVNPLVEGAMAAEAAEHRADARASFLKTMSHELRTPINGVLGMADLLAHQDLDDRQKVMVSTIHQSGLDLLTMITAVLDTTQIGSGALDLATAEFDVAEMADDVAAVNAPAAERQGLSFVAEIDRAMPRRIGDRHRIAQMLNNLLSNAIKFSSRGTVRLVIDSSRADRLVMIVADEGVGMTPAQTESIFEPFVQLDSSTTRQFGGAGLGLTIVHGLVQAMGGTITVDTTPGKGARFAITLPVPAVIERSSGWLTQPHVGATVATEAVLGSGS